ncbi:MAG TPA: extracellular solute-binding protein, partial [Chromatiaceae bacterium]|nr:extracellular solute-binding protein [Chromatiaceae bacterium]
MRQLASVADTIVLNRPLPVEAISFFLDMESFVAAENSFNIADFWPGLVAGCQTGERLTALPITVSLNLLFFDKAAFDKAGLPQPEPGWTWTDFQNAVQSLAPVDEEQAIQYGFVDHGRPLALLGPLVDNAIAANNDDSGAMAKALNWYVSLANEGNIPTFDDEQTAFTGSEALINGRQVALWIGPLLDIDQKQSLFGNDLGIAPYPVATGATQTTPAFPACVAISAGTVHPQAAWTWLNFLSRYSMSMPDRSIPSRPSVAVASGYWDNLAEETAVTLRYALEHAWYGNFNPSLQPIAETLNQVLSGNADLETAWLTITELPPTILPSTPDDNSISVATPRPAAVPLPVTDQTATISYFVDGNFHTSFEVVATLAETFNQQNAGSIVQVSEDATVFGSGYNASEVGQYYDCFAHTGSAGALLTSEAYNLDPFFVTEPGGFRDDFDNVALET